ncbi:MAG: hypothetical protein ACE5GY_01540 [Thermodesulfobacteriota bacterium]
MLYSRESIKASARKMLPFMLDDGAKDAHADVEAVVANLLGSRARPAAEGPAPVCGGHEVFGFNDNVAHNGTVYHVQTEAHGGAEPLIETIVYQGGRIFFTKRTAWGEVASNGGSVRDFAQRQHRAAMAAVRKDKIDLQG